MHRWKIVLSPEKPFSPEQVPGGLLKAQQSVYTVLLSQQARVSLYPKPKPFCRLQLELLRTLFILKSMILLSSRRPLRKAAISFAQHERLVDCQPLSQLCLTGGFTRTTRGKQSSKKPITIILHGPRNARRFWGDPYMFPEKVQSLLW